MDRIGVKLFKGADLSVFASPTAICRLPNDRALNGRLPQSSWKVTSAQLIDVNPLLEFSRVRARELKEQQMRPRSLNMLSKSSRTGNEKLRANEQFSREELGSVLQKLSIRSQSSFTCCCPVHLDTQPSAFVSSNGFIYCSVCCSAGKAWIARIVRKPFGVLEVLRNEN